MRKRTKKPGPESDAKDRPKRKRLPGELSCRQEAAALALAQGCTQAQAGEAAKVNARRIRRWKAEVPGFVARMEELRAEITAGLLPLLTTAAGEAVLTLLRDMRKAKDPRERKALAESIMDRFPGMRGTIDLEERLRRLEESNSGRTDR